MDEQFIELPIAVKIAVIYERVDELKRQFERRNNYIRNLTTAVAVQVVATIGGFLLLGMHK